MPGLDLVQLGHLSSFYKCDLEKKTLLMSIFLETKQWHDIF